MTVEELDQLTWTAGTACRVAGVPMETMRAWSNRGIFALESEREDSESGNWRRFTLNDVARLSLVRRLTEAGVRPGFAVNVANHVVRYFTQPAFFVAVRNGNSDTMVGSSDPHTLAGMLAQPDTQGFVHPVFIVLNVAELYRQVDEALGAEEPSGEVHFD